MICLLKFVGDKYEHEAAITALDIERSAQKRIFTGDKYGTLRIWDILADINCVITRHKAHKAKITGISTSVSNCDLFVTCGADRATLLWDERQPRPAISLWDGNIVNNTAIYWTTPAECNEMVLVGDITGHTTVLDPRKPKEPLLRKQVASGCVTNFCVSSQNVFVASFSCSNLVYKLNNGNLQQIYKESTAPSYVTGCAWVDDKTFWSIGWKNYVEKHVLNV